MNLNLIIQIVCNSNYMHITAFAVKNELGQIVGYVPFELSKIFNKFLREYRVKLRRRVYWKSIQCGQRTGIPLDYSGTSI